jgi:hypothetical protein
MQTPMSLRETFIQKTNGQGHDAKRRKGQP